MRKILLLMFIVECVCFKLSGQSFNVDDWKNIPKARPIRFTGGIAANAVYYTGDGSTNRAPFTYYLQGNVNANLFGQINLPFSFNITNAGSNFTYPTPPTRLSLNPTYKWITAHIGDVGMSFSPYTLNGLQFRGGGVDLAPAGPFKFSAMYGELQRAVEYDSVSENITPGYKRMGYGAKVTYEKEHYRIGLIVFGAKDNINSIHSNSVLDSLLIFPEQNLVVSWQAGVKPVKGLEINAEYATSALTNIQDTLNTATRASSYIRPLVAKNGATNYYTALKTQMNYTYRKSSVGIGYERVDPGYQTLGAYYFNNDLENITANVAQSMFKDKASIAVNIGLQHDDLNNEKSSGTRRYVGSVNFNFTPGDRLQMSLNYSNFQTYMNVKSQFDYINQYSQFQNFDTLNYTQLSQNANLNVNLITKKSKTQVQSLNINANFQDASDEQGGVVANGNASQFYNLASSYNIAFLQSGISVIGAYNLSYNTIGRDNQVTMGPTLGMNGKFLNKKMTMGFSASYNFSTMSGVNQNSVLNFRANAAYTIFKKHNLNFYLIHQTNSVANKNTTQDLTVTFGYGYNF